MRVSTSSLDKDYVPWEWLKHYDVSFRGKAPPMFRVADSDLNQLVLPNGRVLHGEVEIKENPPF